MQNNPTVMEEESRPHRWAVGPILVLAAMCLAGAILRVHGIGQRGLWLDEALSVLYARLDWAQVVDLRRAGTNPPLYHFLLSLWVRAFGDGEAAVRMMSAVFGVASIWTLYRLTRAMIDERAAWLAAAMLCISDMAVAYSQEARFYALNEWLSIVTTWALYAWATSGRRRHLVAYTALMVIFVWTHLYAWFVFAAHGVWMGWRILRTGERHPTFHRTRRDATIAAGVILVAFLPWVPVLVDQMKRVVAGYWIAKPSPAAPALCLYDFLYPLDRLRLVVGVLAAAGFVLAIWYRVMRRSEPAPGAARREGVPLGLLIAWLVIPTGVPFLWSLVATPIFLPKYAVVAQPAALILFAWAARRMAVAAAALLAAVSVWAIHPPEYPLMSEQWREAAAIVNRDAPAEAPVYVCQDYCFFALAYYLDDEMRVTPVWETESQRGRFDPHYPKPAISLEEMLRRLGEESGEAWLVVARVRETGGPASWQKLTRELSRLRDVVDHRALRHVDVFRLRARDSAGKPSRYEADPIPPDRRAD
jgi:mannosyltransferase